MTIAYQDALTTLHYGDCLDVLPTLSPGSIDLLLTDPPYGIGYSTGHRRHVVRSSTRLVNDHVVAPLLNDTAAMVAPLLNDTAAIYWFAAPKMLDVVMPIVRTLGELTNVLVWDKGNGTAGDLEATYGQQWEAILFARRARVRLIGRRDRDVIPVSRGDSSAYMHPTQKPITLLRYLICRHTPRLILDPFAGSASTLVAARSLGVPSIGIELDERHVEVAVRRLETYQPALFAQAGAE